MAPSQKSGWSLYVRLSAMMFLEFAVWGAWSVMIAKHMDANLHFTGMQIGLVFGTTAIGSILAPMIAGWVADRIMPNQIFTALSHLVGAVLLVVAWKQTTFPALYAVMILYSLAFMPTLALTNAIAFHHMGSSEKFGNIRVWGTIGWIAVQWALAAYIGYWATQGAGLDNLHSADCLIFAAVASVLLAVYCLTLPNTPPSKNAENPYAFIEAFKLAKNRNFAILLLISFVVAIELPFYYNLTLLYLTEPIKAVAMAGGKTALMGGVGLNLDYGQFVMTYGQIGEMVLMVLLYPAIRKLGIRGTIFLGILAWPVRYAIFAFAHTHPTLVVAALPLHGICYAFFFAGGMIAVEQIAHKDIRASAQSLMLFATNGCGMLVGHLISGWADGANRISIGLVDGKEMFVHNWTNIFMIPIVVTAVAGVIFLALFNEKQFQADSRRIKAQDATVEGAAPTAEPVA